MNTKIILVAIVLALAIGGIYVANNKNNAASNPNSQISTKPSQNSSQTKTENKTKYFNFTPQALSEAQANGRAILFFHANWCPTCRALDKELSQQKILTNNQLPEDVTILKLDYDTEKELKEKYNVTVQHTLVQVDKNGNSLNQWVGGGMTTIKNQLI